MYRPVSAWHAMQRIAHRSAEPAQLPVEAPSHAVLCRVAHEVVEHAVPADDAEASPALVNLKQFSGWERDSDSRRLQPGVTSRVQMLNSCTMDAVPNEPLPQFLLTFLVFRHPSIVVHTRRSIKRGRRQSLN